jgi:hypothetical protein
MKLILRFDLNLSCTARCDEAAKIGGEARIKMLD